MAPLLTKDQIDSVIQALPIQYRIIMRLLLVVYFDVTEEDIEHIAADRPDPRFPMGGRPVRQFLSRDTIQGVADRVEQYRGQVRQKRERLWLQMECTKKQISHGKIQCRLAEELLASRFGYDAETMGVIKQKARSAVPKPALRALERKWERDEISQEDYLKERLPIEYQLQVRRLERENRRFELAQHELKIAGTVPLQDHEIAHIWGIPFGSLAARKVKALHQYLQNLQEKVRSTNPSPTDPKSQVPIDLWKETFATLSPSPVLRSVAIYDGFEGTEAALTDKLSSFAAGSYPEENETRFWQTISRDYSPNAVEGQGKRQSLFALQRLLAILSDIDLSPETLEQSLLAKISPKPKVAAGESPEFGAEPVPQIGEMAEHVLRSFRGEDRA